MISPILRDFPDAFETERLLIRSPLPGDSAELNAAVIESLDSLRPWLDWARKTPMQEDSEEHVRRARVAFLARTDLVLHLYLKGTKTLVGSSGLHSVDWSVPKFDIGYWCRTHFQGQGYITEAVSGITSFAFEMLGARRVGLYAEPESGRAGRVPL
jgi:RimJ/RimL family protein N-acetyltransferase